MIKYIKLFLLAILPSRLKILLLNMRGHKIHPTCKIGICYLDIAHITLKEGASINHLNVFKGLKSLEMGSYARIGGRLNWFTASALHDRTPSFGKLTIGDGSNITSKHFFDLQQQITIGKNSLIAGFRSTFWTHGYRTTEPSNNHSIKIGDHCYIGSQVIFTPGSGVGDMVFVGTGSVVTKDWTSSSKCLIAGNPATTRKKYTGNEEFFTHSHYGFRPTKK